MENSRIIYESIGLQSPLKVPLFGAGVVLHLLFLPIKKAQLYKLRLFG
jgi:hypothetical protein